MHTAHCTLHTAYCTLHTECSTQVGSVPAQCPPCLPGHQLDSPAPAPGWPIRQEGLEGREQQEAGGEGEDVTVTLSMYIGL